MGDYYDVDCILADEERVPTTFRETAFQLGYLDPGSTDDDILRDTKVDLPLWLARTLAGKQLVKLTLPKCYEPRFRNSLNADPCVVDLHRFQYYYDTGLKLASYLQDEDLKNLLERTFLARYKMILQKSLHMRDADVTEFTTQLTVVELKLFQAGYISSIEYESWKNRKGKKIATASVLTNSTRKRKRNND